MRRLRAEALNLAGRWSFAIGARLLRLGFALCGAGGSLDTMADTAGYWNWHTTATDEKERP